MLGKQEAAAGITIQAMHEFEAAIRFQLAKNIDDAEVDAGTAVDGNAGGLVDYQDVVGLIQHRLLDRCHQFRRR